MSGRKTSWRFYSGFEGQGVKISRLMTDNGPGNRSKLLARTLDAVALQPLEGRAATDAISAATTSACSPASSRRTSRARRAGISFAFLWTFAGTSVGWVDSSSHLQSTRRIPVNNHSVTHS